MNNPLLLLNSWLVLPQFEDRIQMRILFGTGILDLSDVHVAIVTLGCGLLSEHSEVEWDRRLFPTRP